MLDLHEKAFVRNHGSGDYFAYKAKVSLKLSERNMFYASRRVVNSFMKIEERDSFLAYRFELVRIWIKRARRQDAVFSFMLRQVIRRLLLADHLSAYEQNFLASSENLVFVKDRSVKNLAVDFAKNDGEIVGFHYDNVTIRQLIANEQRTLIEFADVYFSSQRILFASAMHTFWLPNAEVKSLVVEQGILRITKSSGEVFLLSSDTPRVLFTAFNKMRR